jgi:hypothetical protein
VVKAGIRTLHRERGSGPAAKITDRFERARRGEKTSCIIEPSTMLRQYSDYVPTAEQAQAASLFRGRAQPHLVAVLQRGRVMQTTVEVVSTDIANRWRPKTQEAKDRAATQFQAFLAAVGLRDAIFPPSGRTPEKTQHQRGVEEDALTGFALNRAMAGHGLKGVLGIISHVRTWYEHRFHEKLGAVRCGDTASPTSKYIKAMEVYYPIMDSTCKKRAPMTPPLVEMMERAGRPRSDDAGAAIVIAFSGLFRMGELTATEGGFDPVEDMTETDVTFHPNFWNATRVVIELGRSKADQDGSRSKLRPRILPVDNDVLSPGRVLQQMLAERYGIRKGQPLLTVTGRPLFQDGKSGQLKQSAVLTFMRRTLERSGGLTTAAAGEFGTHSCRIGGATRLFELGATPEIIKDLGGWSSEAWRSYIRIHQQSLMTFARSMCR